MQIEWTLAPVAVYVDFTDGDCVRSVAPHPPDRHVTTEERRLTVDGQSGREEATRIVVIAEIREVRAVIADVRRSICNAYCEILHVFSI